MEIIAEFIKGKKGVQHTVVSLPRVGDKLEVFSTRDENGNYTKEKPKLKISGVVVKIDHQIMETGESSATWRVQQYATVTLI